MSELNFLHSGGDKVTLTAPASNPSTNPVFKLPQADGGAGDLLQTDGSGGLSFVTTHSNPNLAINGAMNVAQRGTSTTSVSASGYYACDRMKFNCYVGSERYTVSQETDAPTGSGFTKSFKIQTTTADTTPNTGTYALFQYSIEGQDLQHLLKGTSSAKKLTFSFWVKGNTNYTPVAELKDNTNVRINVQTFNVTSSWTKIVLTYVGDTTGTIDDDNTAGLSFNIWLKASAYYGGGTSPAQNTWVAQSSHNIRAALLTFDIAESTARFFQITGLKIEVGDTATSFEHRHFAEELALCQRYFYMAASGADNATNTVALCMNYSSASARAVFYFPVTMRTIPDIYSVEGTNYFKILQPGGTTDLPDSIHGGNERPNMAEMAFEDDVSGMTAGQVSLLRLNNAAARIGFTAEL